MWMMGPLGFGTPWLLSGLLALPLLYLMLRAVPPAPIRRRFPGVALLLGLADKQAEAARTPWWLMVLRIAALAAAIIGFAGPVLHPAGGGAGTGPLLILTDASWASARDWAHRQARITQALEQAQAAGRPVALVALTDPPPEPVSFKTAEAVTQALPGVQPKPWEPQAGLDPASFLPDGPFDTLWVSDGLSREDRDDLRKAVEAAGHLRVWQSGVPVLALGPSRIADRAVEVPVRAGAPLSATIEVTANGLDPAGIERELARSAVAMGGRAQAVARFDLPPELRNRVTRFEIAGLRSAGAVSLTDDAVKRRKVAVISGGTPREGLELLDPAHFLQEALEPTTDLIHGTLDDVLVANPDVIILADVASIADPVALENWVDAGGLLVRFAGPRLASATQQYDPLLPVQLRAGGRSIGGTMSWGDPRALAPFPEGSPFEGLEVPPDVTVQAQVMAQPGPELGARTIARLVDGTPLVTRAPMGDGAVVLFHVTANADWSSLPLSILFPQMLERLAISTSPDRPEAADLAGVTWVPQQVMDGFGALSGASGAAGVAGEDLARGVTGPDLMPGLYTAQSRAVALNAVPAERALDAPRWPDTVIVEGQESLASRDLEGSFLAAAFLALMLDILATLFLSGRLRGPRGTQLAGVAVAVLALTWVWGANSAAQAQADARSQPVPAQSQQDTGDGGADPMPLGRAIQAASNVVFAHIVTGDAEVDRIAQAGLAGLSQTLFQRTTVEPSTPMALDLETDDLALFTLIYWPVTADQPAPSPQAYAKLNRYLRAGGMILFDTRDADVSGMGTATPEGRRLQALAAPLDIPPLAPIPEDHVLTRTFYLLQSFPGRFDAPIWVEAAAPSDDQAQGMPFRNLNDGVTPVVIGGNDWAGAWAVDKAGRPMRPVGRGMGGERQREMARRFGVNLVMHVLTGNYKSDQVHVPALLERLGQ
ncbi:DUF4159 domain-containing protein [Rhodobacteraceae bacterium]|nr:DUF4159 domain-containing protein [Paracoccaceae bacterium]